MTDCFLGRGTLYVALSANDAPYLPLAGESEITVSWNEEILEIKDSRHGRAETVAAFDVSLTGGLTAASGKISKDSLALLLKSDSAVVAPGAVVKSFNVVVGGIYHMAPALSALSATYNAGANVVNPTKYSVDLSSGLITVLDPSGTTQPWEFTGTTVSRTTVGLGVKKNLTVKAMVVGTKALTKEKFVALFPKCYLNMGNAFNLVSKEFKQTDINLTLLSDNTLAEVTPQVGRFGSYNIIP